MLRMIVPVLLSGGIGSRLWPVSRNNVPKQFANVLGTNRTLFQATAERIEGLSVDHSGWVVVVNEEHRFLAADQLKQSNTRVERIILEPVGKNTAPAIALAALYALEKFEDPKLLVQPSDHLISDNEYFCQKVESAYRCDQELITLGVIPDRSEPGYGYILKAGKAAEADIFEVAEFIEKPSPLMAKKYLEDGRYLWNTGIFLVNARVVVEEFRKFCPAILDACIGAIRSAKRDLDFLRVDEDEFRNSPSDSIDFAVMERTKKLRVMPYDSSWSDLGAWDSISRHVEQDEDGNSIEGNGVLLDSTNTMIRGKQRLVAGIGVEDLVIVDTVDAMLVARKDCSQKVKELVERLVSVSGPEVVQSAIGYRPWGTFECLARGDGFQVKRLNVVPGASLSLQMHLHRSEHWIVVQGVAQVRCGEDDFLLKENESTFIPVRKKHRLSNPYDKPLTVIEVQCGNYLSEDDIVRFDDIYGRLNEGFS